jgi:hypothetical protein
MEGNLIHFFLESLVVFCYCLAMNKYFTDFANLLISNRPEINFGWSDSAICCAYQKQEQWEEMIQAIAGFLESKDESFIRSEWLKYIDNKLS